ncbi:aspartate/glutamate racemase family protein [Brevibacillus migulae]|uniref:aspartate/glutamate racemase family protein n=1 Tax=Brevibacillus migulae TaxID=1644114 RepID=UPI00106E527E|nr:aspartate/glutamate racemase family protein [Brevibacillus migulae]
MKTIGLLGGMSWESTSVYYRFINEAIREKRGGLHSAKCLLYSVDFAEIAACQKAGDWEQAARILGEAAKSLEQLGADCLVVCTNTMHKIADSIQQRISIPLIHIADTTSAAIQAQGLRKVGLLGTSYTMEQDFYKGRLREHGLEVLIPGEEDRELVNRVIFGELCLGEIREESKRAYLRIIDDMAAQGAEGIILGCTEITLLIGEKDTAIPLFDTTYLHAMQAVAYALGEA